MERFPITCNKNNHNVQYYDIYYVLYVNNFDDRITSKAQELLEMRFLRVQVITCKSSVHINKTVTTAHAHCCACLTQRLRVNVTHSHNNVLL